MADLATKRRHTQTMLDHTELPSDQDQCHTALQRIAGEITHDLNGEYPLLLSVMGGAVVFTGQLLPLLRFLLDFDYIHVSRYGGKLADGAFNWERTPDPEQIKNRHAVVSNDALDKGHTMATIQERLREMRAASCRATIFASKLTGKKKPAKADYAGLNVPSRYVFGCGMDTADCWHNLDEIYALSQD